MTERKVIRIRCPNLGCQRVLGVPSRARGKLVRCRGCGMTIRIPLPKNQNNETIPEDSAEETQDSAAESA